MAKSQDKTMVYIAVGGEYSDRQNQAVFTDENQAALYCAVHDCYIEKWEVDDISIQSDKKPKRIWRYWRYYGELRVYTDDRLTFDNIQSMGKSGGEISLDVDVDYEKAVKIISDKYAQREAERNNL